LVKGNVFREDLKWGKTKAETLFEGENEITIKNWKKIMVNKTNVSKTDICLDAGDGKWVVVHQVDGVLLPKCDARVVIV